MSSRRRVRGTSAVDKRRMLMRARTYTEAAVEAVRDALMVVDTDAAKDLVEAVKALRAIANSPSADATTLRALARASLARLGTTVTAGKEDR